MLFKNWVTGVTALVMLCGLTVSESPRTVSAAGAVVKVQLPSFPVTLNGKSIDSSNAEYPLLVYKDITYFPMTWEYSRALGLDTSWNEAEGLRIRVTGGGGMPQPELGSDRNDPKGNYSAQVVDYPVRIGDKPIHQSEEPYPILSFRNVTYFPMTWRFTNDAFHWKTYWDDREGFTILSWQNKLWTDIYHEDHEFLYLTTMLQGNMQLTKLSKTLDSDPELLDESERKIVDAARTKRAEEQSNKSELQWVNSDEDLQEAGEDLQFNGTRLMSWKEIQDKHDKYYKENPRYEDRGIRRSASKLVLSNQTTLVSVSIGYLNHIPAPYTPYETATFLINGGEAKRLEASLGTPVLAPDGSVWFYNQAPGNIRVSNGHLRGTLSLLRTDGTLELINQRFPNEKFGYQDIGYIGYAQGNMYFRVYNRYLDMEVSDNDGVYLIDSNYDLLPVAPPVTGRVVMDDTGRLFTLSEKYNEVRELTQDKLKFWYDYQLEELFKRK